MMTNETSRFVRWLVIIILIAATVGMFLISMRANYLYGRGIGQTPETKEAIAWANVGADLWKGFGLIVVAALWRGVRRRAALATSLTWLVCLFFSVTSAIGIYVQERTTLTGSREAKHASYEDAKKELADTEAKLEGLGKHRSSAQVEAAIAAVRARPVVVGERVRGTVNSLSANCTKNDARTAAACGDIAEQREEYAAAKEAAKLDARAVSLRQQVSELRERLHLEFERRIKTQTVLPSAETAAMLFWALLASGQIVLRKVDGWTSIARPLAEPIDLAA